jgi:phosphohistidine phosphatase
MRRLTLVRHAKAVNARDHGRDTDRDFERVLSPEGEAEAREMATRWARRGPRPDAILSSPAPRAEQTARIFAASWSDAPRVLLDPRLYLATAEVILEVLRTQEPIEHVLIVGHNPGVSDLARRIGDEPARGDLDTAGLLHLEFDLSDWGFLGPGADPVAGDSVDRD